ncbi:MAG: SAM-dependent methyltransferase [Bacteroidales bacterium]|nr:SAM-dependent methyltransferase [Bacteroidales bacterium]
MEPGKLFLIPSPIGNGNIEDVMPASITKILGSIRHFVVEDVRTARRFIKKAIPSAVIDDMHFELLNEHTELADIPHLIKPLIEGNDVGLISEAGVPCVADPGSALVMLAHAKGIQVIPVSGPSSIIMALMASGFNGQSFTFHGYLPVDKQKRVSAIKKIEQDAYKNDQTQIFIETPYRNMKLLESILSVCNPVTRLCIAANISDADEMIATRTVEEWQKHKPGIHKQPAVFLLYK